MPFRKGQSGNPGGRGSDKEFRRALQLELKEMDGDRTKLRKVAAAVVKAAIGGDMRAVSLIADRMDGKAPQAVSLGEDPDNSLAQILRKIDGTTRGLPVHSQRTPAEAPRPNGKGY